LKFKRLFDIVYENPRARNAASGGEEMLRLRGYEKLQNLVAPGAVKKSGKQYKGLPTALANAIAPRSHLFNTAVRLPYRWGCYSAHGLAPDGAGFRERIAALFWSDLFFCGLVIK
jgi:hypothetical protein